MSISNLLFKKSALVVLVALGILLPSTVVLAQSPTAPTLVQSSQSWKCLRGNVPAFSFITGSAPSITQPVHGEGFPQGKDVYLVGCAPTSQGSKCTSGDALIDLKLFKVNNTSIPVKFREGSLQTSSYGKVDATAIISGTQTGSGKFDFYGIVEGVEKMIIPGDEKSQQQQTVVTFEDITDNCVSIAWANVSPPAPVSADDNRPRGRKGDPFGIVFDSQSLEPLKEVTVTVYDSNKQKLNLLGLTNPQTTKEDGLFNFLVPDGTYYLNVAQKPGYAFTASPKLDKNVELVYVQNNGKTTIYKPDEAINEKIDTDAERKQNFADPERRNIPLDPGTNAPSRTTPVSILYSTRKVGETTEISGRVSHPLTQVNVVQGTKVLSTAYANNDGFYTVSVKNSDVSPSEKLDVTFKKTDLTGDLSNIIDTSGNSSNSQSLIQRGTSSVRNILSELATRLVLTVSAQSTSISLDPILSKVEGYAYDASGKIVPNATVNVVVQNSKQPVYTTKANAKGYFTIDSKNLPPIAYTIEVVSPTGLKTTKTTTSFAKENKDYLAKNNVQLTTNDKTVSVKTNAQVSPGTRKDASGNSVASANNTNATKEPAKALDRQQTMTVLYFVIILVLVLTLVGVGIWYFLSKKKEENLPPPTMMK